jgi:hypothetical protein
MTMPTDCLSRAMKSRARLRPWSVDAFAASFIGRGQCVSAPAKTRVLEVVYCSCTQARNVGGHRAVRSTACVHEQTPHPPKGGFGMHVNITHGVLCASRCTPRFARLLIAGCPAHRPHNMRYVGVHAQRAKTLAVESGEAPQCRSPAHPRRVVRSRATVARCLQHRFAPAAPRGSLFSCFAVALRMWSLARSARRFKSSVRANRRRRRLSQTLQPRAPQWCVHARRFSCG